MTSICLSKPKKDNFKVENKSKNDCEKLAELTAQSVITSKKHQALLSFHFHNIEILEGDGSRQQNQKREFIYICAGPDLRKLPQVVDGLLLNVVDNGITPKKYEDAIELKRRTRPRYLMLDSSGFRIHQAEKKGIPITFNKDQALKNNKNGINIAPNHLMQVALILNPDIVVGLDLPVSKLKLEAEREQEFLKKYTYNVQFAFESYEWKNKLVPHCKYFQPIQGYTLDHFKTFLDEIECVDFDGISMPVRNMNISELAVILVFLYQRGIKNIHLLGTSAFSRVGLCAYAARNMFEWVSLDSTSWRMAAQHHEFYYPSDLKTEHLGRTFNVNFLVKNPCNCHFCCGRSFYDIHSIEQPNERVQLLLQHNYLMIENLFKDLFAKGEDIDVLSQDLIDRCRTDYRRREVKKLITVLSIVESFKDGDIRILQDLLINGCKKRR